MPILPNDAIFISYSRSDKEMMQKIAFFLRDQGFKVWVDNEKLIPGTAAWEESIEDAIKNAFAVVVILSPNSKNSEWVRREITYSDQFDKRIFPVLAKGAEEESLPLRLVTRQYVDMRKDEEAGLDALKAAINFYIGEKQTLQMKRPFPQKEGAGHSTSGSIPANSKVKNPPIQWLLVAGAIMAICILGLGGVWAGYKIYTRPVPVANVHPVKPTLTVPAPIETASDAATEPSTEPDMPVPDILAQYLNDVQITQTDAFDNPSGSDWNIQAGTIGNGVMEISGNDNYDGAWYPFDFSDNEGVLIDFSFTGRSTFLVYLNFGSFGTDPFRRFGMYVENGTTPITDIYGPDYIWGGYSGNLSVTPDTVYTLLLAILPNGEILNVIWDPADPNETLEFRNRYDNSWAGLPWTMVIQAQNGSVNFDNFRVIQFSGGK